MLPRFLPPLFGRKDELKMLDDAFGESEMAALVAPGGYGKSLLANTYACDWVKKDDTKRFTISIIAETEAAVQRGYRNVLQRVFNEDHSQENRTLELAKLVWEKLNNVSYDWIFVFDNVPEQVDDKEGPDAFKPWFFADQHGEGRGKILMTTRHASYGGTTVLGYIKKVDLESLPQDVAVEMLLADIVTPSNMMEAAKELVSKAYFDGLTLAIATANSIIREKSFSVQQYLDEIKEEIEKGLFSKNVVNRAVETAIRDALNYARQAQAVEHALNVAAFVNPDRMSLSLLGGNRGALNRLCKLNLFRIVDEDVYSVVSMKTCTPFTDCIKRLRKRVHRPWMPLRLSVTC